MTTPPNTAIIPTPKIENDFYDWYARHEAKCREAASGNHDLVFIGDSITHLFEGDPAFPTDRGDLVWKKYYGQRHALNLGFGWDRTQNVLWRLTHGEFAGQTPRLIVLMIGTNNLTGTDNARTNSPAEIAEGIRAICSTILAASPSSKILLLGIFPRSVPSDPLRERIKEINTLLESDAASRPGTLTFLDLAPRFLSADGSIPTTLFNDGVHPLEKGYQIWAEAIEPIIEATCPLERPSKGTLS